MNKTMTEEDPKSNSAKKGTFVTTSKDYKTLLLNQIDEDNFDVQKKTMEQIKTRMAKIDRNFRKVSCRLKCTAGDNRSSISRK